MSTERFDEARAAFQRGDRPLARRLLSQVLLSDRKNEQAWLLMARLGETEQQVIQCLEWALKINPANPSTRRALDFLRAGRLFHEQPGITSPLRSIAQDITPITRVTLATTPEAQIADRGRVATSNGQDRRSHAHKFNWALFLGTLIVLLVVLIGLLGPQIAPQDPLEEHTILQVGEEWFVPPFEALEVKGYLLGSDEFGRDLLSRILYAVRPTMIMVAIVAIVRLTLGTLIGLGAGWSTGRAGRILDALISAALSIPILLVALAAIAMLGAELGLLAFIIGLSINGWGETARFVREQTRIIKGQLYIESAHALGASTLQMLIQHTLRQIMPMIWMLFAFEVSGTLMVTAGLGFLGYFIGGDLWIEVDDFLSRRTSGAPELGQMLATSWVNLIQPWPMVLTGSVIFSTILGFNLLGEGLRTRLNPEFINRNSSLALLSERLRLWYEENISYPLGCWFRSNRLIPAFGVLALVSLVGGIYLYQTRLASLFNPSRALLEVPGGQIWASERVDPYGTGYISEQGITAPQVLWTLNRPAGFSGAPAISSDGRVYVASLDGNLIALDSNGAILWESNLPETPLGSLAIGLQGEVYVTDQASGLSAFSPDGSLLWRVTVEATGRPIHGSIVGPGGTIYYLLEDPRGDTLSAITPAGQPLWSVKTGTRSGVGALRLSPDGKQIFVKNVILNALDGGRVNLTLPTDNSPVLASKATLFVGADGKTYLLAGHVVVMWGQTSQGFEILQSADWNYHGLGFYQSSAFPMDSIVTPSGEILLVYSGYYGSTRIVWLDPTGKYLGASWSPLNLGTRLVAVDKVNRITLCGVAPTEQGEHTSMCAAYEAENDTPLWRMVLGVEDGGIIGAAMAPGRLYVITADGNLTALGDGSTSPTSAP